MNNAETYQMRDLIADALADSGYDLGRIVTFGGPIITGLTITTEDGSEFQVTITRSKGADQ